MRSGDDSPNKKLTQQSPANCLLLCTTNENYRIKGTVHCYIEAMQLCIISLLVKIITEPKVCVILQYLCKIIHVQICQQMSYSYFQSYKYSPILL